MKFFDRTVVAMIKTTNKIQAKIDAKVQKLIKKMSSEKICSL